MRANGNQGRNELSLVLAGEAGQGVQTVELLLTRAFRQEGYHVFSAQEFMSRIRGGSNSTLLRVGTRSVRAWSERADLCIVFDEKAVAHLGKRLNPETFVLGDGLKGTVDQRLIDVPLEKLAKDAGGQIFVNTIAAGIRWGMFYGSKEPIKGIIKGFFTGKPSEIIDKNLTAVGSGMKLGRELRRSGQVSLSLPPPSKPRRDLHLTGTEAVALGVMAGGCNFVSSYPMSPSTGVLAFLAQHGRDFGIIVEQAEDEISAANMVLGAWYAGARGLPPRPAAGLP